MQHTTKSAFTAGAIEFKDGNDTNPVDVVTKAIADLTKTVDDRLKVVDGIDIKALNTRLDTIETELARPNVKTDDKATEPAAETKAFATYLRFGAAAPAQRFVCVGPSGPSELISTKSGLIFGLSERVIHSERQNSSLGGRFCAAGRIRRPHFRTLVGWNCRTLAGPLTSC